VKIPEDENNDEMVLNLTPMIDVVFLLLIFFMVATTFLDPEREIDLELPKAESGRSAEQVLEELVINVMRDGSVTLSGQQVDRDGLLQVLRTSAQQDPTTPVTIRGDRLSSHESIVTVMDACGVAGLRNLSVGTLEGT